MLRTPRCPLSTLNTAEGPFLGPQVLEDLQANVIAEAGAPHPAVPGRQPGRHPGDTVEEGFTNEKTALCVVFSAGWNVVAVGCGEMIWSCFLVVAKT